MVLPTDDHTDLAVWLDGQGVKTGELASMLVTRNLNNLLAVSGSTYRVPDEDLTLLSEARRWLAQFRPLTEGGPGNGHGPDGMYAGVHRILETVCAELREQRVVAEPHEGLGVISGSEVLEGRVRITDTARLYALKGAVSVA